MARHAVAMESLLAVEELLHSLTLDSQSLDQVESLLPVAVDSSQLRHLLSAERDGCSFHFIQSQIVRCIQKGEWLILKNVEQVNPAILSKLFPILSW